ncbi:MAG: zinc ABC transporter substrate-binding protein [Synechococcales bacterium]|nr:zinc ABC transporter substrate-binding protein [Synechococcales bacterium]
MQIHGTLGRLTAVVASAIALGLGSCGPSPTPTEETTSLEGNPPAAEAALQVVTTFLPMTQFTKAVVGDRAEVTQLLPTNVGPHDYQAKPEDALAIANADVLVQNGLELEFFLEDLIANAGDTDLVIIDSSEGINTLVFEEAGHSHAEEDHDHDHDHAEGEDHDHAEGEDHDSDPTAQAKDDHHHHGEFDPHVWLDPKRAIDQVENIRDGLIAVDPEGEAEYTANAAAYIEQLQTLDTDIAELLAPYAGQTFVSFHDFAFYFADSYGLNAEYLVDIPEENPSPEDVRRIIEITQAENIKALLTEPQAGEEAFDSLAKDLNVQVSVFDPMETGEPAATEPEYYLTIMRQNAASLKDAFGDSPQSWLYPWLLQPVATLPQRTSQWF